MRSSTESGSVVEKLTHSDKGPAVEVLAVAFHEYPVMRYVLQDAGTQYEAQLRALIGFFCQSRLSRDWPLLGIRQNGSLVAIAAANSPGSKPRPPELQETYEQLKSMIGHDAIGRLELFERISSVDTPVVPHYYLGMIGVIPELQGTGFARILMDHLHRMSDDDPASTGTCLSTENPDNVALYRHMGYQVVGQAVGGHFRTWSMFRAKNSITNDE